MRAGTFGRQVAVLGALVVGVQFGAQPAQARHATGHSHAYSGHPSARFAAYRTHFSRVSYGGGLQCVPFARENTGIELSGNAATWWGQAAGTYQRGARPEVGSVLNFRATGRMSMGHVAVVSNVINSRTLEIDQANWGGPGRISRDVTVVDVSPANDWTAVRVELDHTGGYGSTYPTYGFIYDRPDSGTMLANTGVTPGTAAITTVAATGSEEVAEAPESDDDTVPHYAHRRFSRHAHLVTRATVYRAASAYARAGSYERPSVYHVHSMTIERRSTHRRRV